MPQDTGQPDCSRWMKPFATFASALRIRLAAGTYTTEDAIRYYFWNALLDAGASLHDMVPERPHPADGMKRKAVDLWIATKPFGPAWLEVKYDRPTPNSDMAHSDNYGALLADFFKLGLIEDTALKLVLYVSTREMLRYHRNRAELPLHEDAESLSLGPQTLDEIPRTARKMILKKVVFGAAIPSLQTRVVTQAIVEDHEAVLFQTTQL